MRRSKITNGSALFGAEGDERGPWARRFRDLCVLHVNDIGPAETLSEAQLSLIRRCTTMEIELEAMEARLSAGESADLDLYNRLAGNLRRLLESLGIERRKRDLVPTLDAYVAMRARETVP